MDIQIKPTNVDHEENQTIITEFWLQGFQYSHQYKILLFFLFLITYSATLTGNALIITLVIVSPELWSPMYFFLSHLSLDEILCTTNIIPNMLNSLLREDGTISIEGCFTQIFLFGYLTVTECFLLTIMSYDRYLAICVPLNYSSLMSLGRCIQLSSGAWVASLILTIPASCFVYLLKFCGSNVIDHFFCDFTLIMKRSCSTTFVTETETKIFAIIVTMPSLLFICFTYIYIIVTILKIPSTIGKQKAFSTCSCHLTVVFMYYGTLIAIYVASTKSHSYNINKILSLLYTVVTPLLNPLIYSLRNKTMKSSFNKAIQTKI
ncbi:olfactory receptor 5G3-like [Bombina bombina]|uniref:olfactory receptor 5G3-like n=1 Tax=Bombina bombina TaxID=8345 RepID=UPI00235AB10F|nr:olfactory receptor 5G3-like [Bombina bombina]